MNRETPSSEQSFTYDNSEQPEQETNYEPEREFVLMPLFRRIGEMLGIRRNAEADYVYIPEPPSTETPTSVAAETETVTEAHEAMPERAELETHQYAAETPTELETEDVLGIEPEIAAEPLATQPQAHFEPERELPSSLPPQEAEPVTIAQTEPEPELALSQSSTYIPDVTIPDVTEAPAPQQFEPAQAEEIQPVAARSETPRPQEVHRALSQDDIKDLTAPIREAAVSISAAILQAAEWLHHKEEEILRRAELPRVQTSEQRQQGPQLVKKHPRVPFWKRIDWDKEFTPRRAAILGALAMAVLMVLGISLARRPASSVLPQQTHAIEPGGVTLTTHAARPVQMSRPSLQSPQRSTLPARSAVPPPRHAHASASADDGQDVVTHYYDNKSKPSPVHQSTVAGVRHYSDMQ